MTLGDPAGIGPEVTEKACRAFLEESPEFALILCGPNGLADVMAARLGTEARVLPPFVGPLGRPTRESGEAALSALDRGMALIKEGEAQALVTAPISKEALALAGSSDRGHTEILARELGQGPVAMSFFSDKLRVVLATTHIPLRDVPAKLSKERVVEVTTLFAGALRQYLGIKRPRLALCGLNPHAGEGGLLGDEEIRVLGPALAACKASGIDLTGPYPSDTLFTRAVAGDFDGVVALYHDQGLIPMKLLSFGDAVNVTLGLSTIRTSPDHGTAYDIVGKGLARSDGMFAALRQAARFLRQS